MISGYVSNGLQCQTSYLDVYAESVTEEIWSAIKIDIEQFSELTKFESNLHVLGSFDPIQYSAADFDSYCLISFPSWGSCGNAQVFVNFVEEDGKAFTFAESLN